MGAEEVKQIAALFQLYYSIGMPLLELRPLPVDQPQISGHCLFPGPYHPTRAYSRTTSKCRIIVYNPGSQVNYEHRHSRDMWICMETNDFLQRHIRYYGEKKNRELNSAYVPVSVTEFVVLLGSGLIIHPLRLPRKGLY